nr:MAG TPA: hypothetical protein [Caudoviricetes sp.]
MNHLLFYNDIPLNGKMQEESVDKIRLMEYIIYIKSV